MLWLIVLQKKSKPQHNYEIKPFYLCAVIQIIEIHSTVRNRPKSHWERGDQENNLDNIFMINNIQVQLNKLECRGKVHLFQ